MSLYSVEAKIRDSKEPGGYRTIWQFRAIDAKSTTQAIRKCKSLMIGVVGKISTDYKWSSELEWENNLAVN